MRRLAFLLALGAVSFTACSNGGATITAGSNLRYEPGVVTVEVGETVTFTNDSDASHTVTAYEDKIPEGGSFFSSGGFTSEREARSEPEKGMLDQGEAFEVTFDAPGTYAYFCVPHEQLGMKGKVIVEDG